MPFVTRNIAVAIGILAALVAFVPTMAALDAWVTPIPAFEIDGELDAGLNLPVLLSSAVLLGAAVAAFNLASRSEVLLRREARAWGLLGGLFAFMSVDEVAGIHEHLEVITGVDWQLLYLPLGLGAGALWLSLIPRLRWRHVLAAGLWLAAGGLWTASQLLEAVRWDIGVGSSLAPWMGASEELLELAGSSLFLIVALFVLGRITESRERLARQPSLVPVLPVAAARSGPGRM